MGHTDAVGTDVLVVGGAGVDTIVRVAALPVPLADSHVVPPIELMVGHTGSGVALGCHRLGLAVRFVDVIGDDHEGRLLLDRFTAEGLPFDHVVHASGTRRAVNLVDEAGTRMSFYDPRHPDDLAPDPALWRGILAGGTRHVHGVDHAVDRARPGGRGGGGRHDLDRPARLGRPQPAPRALRACRRHRLRLRLAAAGHGGRVVADVLDRGRARLVVVMDGARGSRVTVRDGGAFAVRAVELDDRPVVDSNGAGDAYVSAFLQAWLAGADAREAARAGSVAGAWACGTAGTHTSLIDRDELARQLG